MKKRNTMNKHLQFFSACTAVLIITGQTVFAQTADKITKQLEVHANEQLTEKLFVHTDQKTYLTGGLLWFKVYATDGANNKPISMSKVAYIDILDNNQAVILQAKVKLDHASGSGSLYLPNNLVSATYRLRGYTAWMKNFDPGFYFEKAITIVNPQRITESKVTASAYTVQFFPEGGTLVDNVRSKIGFKLAGNLPTGSAWNGYLINARNDTVARFTPGRFNIGSFTFVPRLSETYRAVIKVPGEKLTEQAFIPVAASGYAMHITDDGTDLLKVQVNAKNSGERVFLLTHSQSVTKDVQTGNNNFQVSKAKLGEGINHLTLFDPAGKPVCERLYFKRPASNLQITANAAKNEFGTRNKVSLDIAAATGGKATAADLSAAVIKLDNLQAADDEDIESYLWLRSDLQGNIESPGWYFKNHTAEADSALDNLLLTQGWRRFKWDDILNGKKPVLSFPPEINGHLITARLTNTQTGDVAKNVMAFLSVPGKRVQLSTSKSDSEGMLYFGTKDMFGLGEIMVQTNTRMDSTYRANILTPFSDKFSSFTLPAYKVSASQAESIKNSNLSVQVQNVYHADAVKRFIDPGVDSSAFFGEHSTLYKLDDYVRFTTMEEVLREYVMGVLVSRPRNHFKITVANSTGPLTGTPMVLIDGVPEFDMDKVFTIDPLKISKLNVVHEVYYLGPSVSDGVLSFLSKKGDLAGMEIDPKTVVVDYEGMQLQREFYSPVYETEQQRNSRLPDFRTVLYWTPDAGTDSSGHRPISFYTSDQTGKYGVVVQGITPDGHAGSGTFTFEVK